MRRKSLGDVIMLHCGHSFLAPSVRSQHSSQWTCQQHIDTTGSTYESIQMRHLHLLFFCPSNSRIFSFNDSMICWWLFFVLHGIDAVDDDSPASTFSCVLLESFDSPKLPFISSSSFWSDDGWSGRANSSPPRTNWRRYIFSLFSLFVVAAGTITSRSEYCVCP